MAHSDFRASPLLSTLGIAALAGTAAPMACRDDGGGPPPIEDVSDISDVYQDAYAFYCECYAELYEGYAEGGVEECLAQGDILSDGEEACLQEIFDANPDAFEVVRCQAEALRTFIGCERAEGCPVPFTCVDGTTIPSDFVCDGSADCSDGSDELEDCPPAPTCADGEPLASYLVCDGFEDCTDGSDEQDCPPPFTCGDGLEIPPDWVCDAFADCEDGSDEEQNCPQTCESRYGAQTEACGELSEDVTALLDDCYAFVCFDGTELDRGLVCDGAEDCPEGEDEHACPSPTGG